MSMVKSTLMVLLCSLLLCSCNNIQRVDINESVNDYISFSEGDAGEDFEYCGLVDKVDTHIDFQDNFDFDKEGITLYQENYLQIVLGKTSLNLVEVLVKPSVILANIELVAIFSDGTEDTLSYKNAISPTSIIWCIDRSDKNITRLNITIEPLDASYDDFTFIKLDTSKEAPFDFKSGNTIKFNVSGDFTLYDKDGNLLDVIQAKEGKYYTTQSGITQCAYLRR